MTVEKKGIFSSFSTGNVITLCIILIGVISTWTKIGLHISDKSIHLDPTKKVLTEQEYKDLTVITTVIEKKFETIEDNKVLVLKLDKAFAVFNTKFDYLKEEHEGLESKHSRDFNSINNEIKNLHE